MESDGNRYRGLMDLIGGENVKRWNFPVAIGAPCKDCEKNPCGAYHDKCLAYRWYKAKAEELREKKEAERILRDQKTSFWLDAKKKGVKIGNHKGGKKN